ncbi:MAG: HypC/HybG/HupF family hydrogenase formation chaperone [Firmicutes bacterium]|nr:HypC/HybG/HupF family hydrogenase formation chaperone [Bacillota bacterium]MBQ2455636.1 HypC/HybG/HupF family hydrogenase formation chaperone [Bacillota bacterium]MBQ6013567.1 HypC/HybG/HupF family hydrogenase formation chaperone [Bacillota bacterium]MBR0441493.1 HypC/HybG/HupF family hydrogenase formation chaperone [Bacillota bacterium]
MCLAVPLKLIEIEGNDGVAERDGITRSVRLDFIKEPRLGDYVIVHAGFAIERLNEAQALADIEAAKEIEDELRKLCV